MGGVKTENGDKSLGWNPSSCAVKTYYILHMHGVLLTCKESSYLAGHFKSAPFNILP